MAIKKSEDQAQPTRPQAAFLIRCWREDAAWRYAIEDVASRQKRRYDSLEALLEALEIRLLDISKEETSEE